MRDCIRCGARPRWRDRRICAVCLAAWSREWRQRHPDKIAEKNRRLRLKRQAHRVTRRRYSQRDYVKQLARNAVYRAVRAGRLVRVPCSCGAPESEAHHDDYGQRLVVRWLCRPCHAREHSVYA